MVNYQKIFDFLSIIDLNFGFDLLYLVVFKCYNTLVYVIFTRHLINFNYFYFLN